MLCDLSRWLAFNMSRVLCTTLHTMPIVWVARFREENGEEIYIGEVVQGAGVPASKAPLMDVKSQSDRYEAKDDRIRFLKKNMEYRWVY